MKIVLLSPWLLSILFFPISVFGGFEMTDMFRVITCNARAVADDKSVGDSFYFESSSSTRRFCTVQSLHAESHSADLSFGAVSDARLGHLSVMSVTPGRLQFAGTGRHVLNCDAGEANQFPATFAKADAFHLARLEFNLDQRAMARVRFRATSSKAGNYTEFLLVAGGSDTLVSGTEAGLTFQVQATHVGKGTYQFVLEPGFYILALVSSGAVSVPQFPPNEATDLKAAYQVEFSAILSEYPKPNRAVPKKKVSH